MDRLEVLFEELEAFVLRRVASVTAQLQELRGQIERAGQRGIPLDDSLDLEELPSASPQRGPPAAAALGSPDPFPFDHLVLALGRESPLLLPHSPPAFGGSSSSRGSSRENLGLAPGQQGATQARRSSPPARPSHLTTRRRHSPAASAPAPAISSQGSACGDLGLAAGMKSRRRRPPPPLASGSQQTTLVGRSAAAAAIVSSQLCDNLGLVPGLEGAPQAHRSSTPAGPSTGVGPRALLLASAAAGKRKSLPEGGPPRKVPSLSPDPPCSPPAAASSGRGTPRSGAAGWRASLLASSVSGNESGVGSSERATVALGYEDLEPELAAKVKRYHPQTLHAREKMTGFQVAYFHYLVDELKVNDNRNRERNTEVIMQRGVSAGVWPGDWCPPGVKGTFKEYLSEKLHTAMRRQRVREEARRKYHEFEAAALACDL